MVRGISMPIVARADGDQGPAVPPVSSSSGGLAGKTKLLIGVFATAALVGAAVGAGLVVNQEEKNNILLAEGDEDFYTNYLQPSASPTEAVYTSSPSKSPSDSPTPAPQEPTTSPTSLPTGSPSYPVPTGSPVSDPTVSPTSSPSSAPTSSPTGLPTTSPTRYPTKSPLVYGSPTVSPTTLYPTTSPSASPTKGPTVSPTKAPSSAPSASPTMAPTSSPTMTPTMAPTSTPTMAPTSTPTMAPTSTPTMTPTSTPTMAPTSTPTMTPTSSPSMYPTSTPTTSPTFEPTTSPLAYGSPSNSPVVSPTGSPSATPSAAPTTSPTVLLTASPSASPTAAPIEDTPMQSPTASPQWPTSSPTSSPQWPTSSPTSSPQWPTASPTYSPSSSPTLTPTDAPVGGGLLRNPTLSPTSSPAAAPVGWPGTRGPRPTTSPTVILTSSPTGSPTSFPTVSPTRFVDREDTPSPTLSPSSTGDNEDLNCPNLGIPGNFNGFFCGHFTNDNPGGDIDGRLAVRGDFKASEFSVVSNLEPDVSPFECVAGDFGVVIGGDAEFQDGGKFSLAYSIQGSYTGTGFDDPDCVDNQVGSLPDGWDFPTMCADLSFESDVLASDAYLPASFVRNVTYGSGWTQGESNWRANFMQIPIDSRFAINVITIPDDVDVSRVHTTRFIETDHEPGVDILRAVIINYNQANLQLGGAFKWNTETMDADTAHLNRRVLFNKPSEGTLQLNNAIPFSVLAPRSDVSPASSGVLRGQLFARSYVSEDAPGNNPFISLQWSPFTCAPLGESDPPTPRPTMSPLSSPTPLPTREPNAPPTPAPTGAICPDLSEVSKYNMFVCGDMTNNVPGSDVQGRVAVAGDFLAREWSVGRLLPDQGTCQAGDYSIVVGGSLDWTGTKYSRAGAVAGEVFLNEGTTPVFDPSCADDTNDPAVVASIVDFDGVCQDVAAESSRLGDWAWLANVASNADVTVSDSTYYGGLSAEEIPEEDEWKLRQIELPIDFAAQVNIINVRADLRVGNEINTIRFVTGANPQPDSGFVPVIIVNVHSESVAFGGAFQFLGESLTNTSDMAEEKLSKIIFNMPNAEELYVGTSIPGSILSPIASVVEGSNGVVRGNWIVGNYVSSDVRSFVQVNLPTFVCEL